MARKDLIIVRVQDMAIDLLYYDRKDDEELSPEDIAEALETQEITPDEITQIFSKALKDIIESI